MITTQVFSLFEKLEKTSGRNAKVALLDEFCKSDALKARLAQIVWYTYNPFVTFRISSIDTVGVQPLYTEVSPTTLEETWTRFTYFLDGLRLRTMSVADGRQGLSKVVGSLPHHEQNWFKRIVTRDLKIGIASWDKWFPSLLPRVSPMLCSPWNGEISKPCIVEPKLDGLRAIGVVNGQSETQWLSRNGKELYNTSHIDESIKKLGLRNVVLDGEFDAGTFGESMSITKSQAPHKNAEKLRLYLFDMLDEQAWYKKTSSDTTVVRKERIADTFKQTSSNVVVVPYVHASSSQQVLEVFDQHVAAGYEGSIIKDAEAPYICDDRSELWQKIKPTETADMTVYDIEEGTGRNEKRCGALKVRGIVTYKSKQYEIDTRVGTGFSDSDREKFWNMALSNTLNGTVIEVRFQDVTVANLSAASARTTADNYSLRFPVFLRVREDKQ